MFLHTAFLCEPYRALLCKPYEVPFVHCKAHIRSSVNFIAYILLVPFENMQRTAFV